jgi:hypothetical protein
MAWISAVFNVESDPIPPALAEIAAWIWEAVLPLLLLVARAPWQERHLFE